MALQMIRWNKSGEIMVIDAERGICSDTLHHSELTEPIESYNLDHELGEDDDYTVVERVEAAFWHGPAWVVRRTDGKYALAIDSDVSVGELAKNAAHELAWEDTITAACEGN